MHSLPATATAPANHGHYPYLTRQLIELFAAGELPNVEAIQIEPDYGWTGRIVYRDGAVRLFRGTSMGINRLGASEVARDKGYTKFFLRELGYATPAGKIFLFPRFVQKMDRNLGRHGFADYAAVASIPAYLEASGGYPCYLKPNEGSQGRGIEFCAGPEDVRESLARMEEEGALKVLVEHAVPWPDYRVVVLGGDVISCYLRKPLCVRGDGRSSVEQLLVVRQQEFEREGRDTIIHAADPRIDRTLAARGRTRQSVPATGEEWPVHAISNLSAGGESEDCTAHLHPHWAKLCTEVTAAMGLRLCGVDLACEDIGRPDADYSILEINAAPGLDNYAAAGAAQAAVVRELYRRVFNEGAAV